MRYVELVDIIFAKISTADSTTEGHHEIHCYTSCHVQGVAIQQRAWPHGLDSLLEFLKTLELCRA